MNGIYEGVQQQHGYGANAAVVSVSARKMLPFCTFWVHCDSTGATHLSCLATSPSSLVSIGVSIMTRSPVMPTAEEHALEVNRSPSSLGGMGRGEDCGCGKKARENLRWRMILSLSS